MFTRIKVMLGGRVVRETSEEITPERQAELERLREDRKRTHPEDAPRPPGCCDAPPRSEW